jgi:hypothetical protein
MKPTWEDKFWAKVEMIPFHPCYEWAPGKKEKTYGVFRDRKQVSTLAHRLSWVLHFGPIPNKLWVLHRCDNPPCVRPEHLFLGTVQDNNADRDHKGRKAMGSLLSAAKLSEADVIEMRNLVLGGATSRKAVCIKYGITKGTLSKIVCRKAWRHV